MEELIPFVQHDELVIGRDAIQSRVASDSKREGKSSIHSFQGQGGRCCKGMEAPYIKIRCKNAK